MLRCCVRVQVVCGVNVMCHVPGELCHCHFANRRTNVGSDCVGSQHYGVMAWRTVANCGGVTGEN